MRLIAVVLALWAAAAAAQQEPGVYLGASLGGGASNGCDDIRVGVSCKDGVANLKIFAGYQINRNLAVEAGYTNTLAKTNAESSGAFGAPFTSEVRTRAFDFVGIPMLPIGASASLYAKLGVYVASTEETFFSPPVAHVGGTTTTSDSNLGGTLGAGFAWSLGRRVTARVDWQRFQSVGGDSVRSFNVDTLNLGVLYRF